MVPRLILVVLMLGGCDRGPAASSPASAPASMPASAPAVDRLLRVLLLNGVPAAGLAMAGPFSVLDSQSREILRTEQAPRELAILFRPSGIEFPELSWETDRPMVDLVPTGDRTARVKIADDWKEFRGVIRLLRRPDGGVVLNLVDIEDYLPGVVSSELPGNFLRETFRAQAIASRTYAWYLRQTYGRKRDWDLGASEKSQVYRGVEKSGSRAAEAVRDTRGLVCTWPSPQGDKIFCAYFSSRCGGTTAAVMSPGRDSPVPPLAGGVACEYCRRPDSYHWPQDPRLAKELIGKRLAERYTRFVVLGMVDRVEITEGTPDGRALRVSVSDTEGHSLELDAENFRLTVDPSGRILQSTYFKITVEPDSILFTEGRGMGHGMGLCQYGADALARSGVGVAAILKHYYPGSHLTRAY